MGSVYASVVLQALADARRRTEGVRALRDAFWDALGITLIDVSREAGAGVGRGAVSINTRLGALRHALDGVVEVSR